MAINNTNQEYDSLDVIFQKALKMLRNVPADQRDAYYDRMDAAIGNSGQSVMKRLESLELIMNEIATLIPASEPMVVVRPTRKSSAPYGKPLKLGGMTRPYDANWGKR